MAWPALVWGTGRTSCCTSTSTCGQCWGIAAVCADPNEAPNDMCVPPPILVIVQNRTVVNLKDKWRNMLRAGTTGM